MRHTYRKSVLSQVKEFVKPVQFDYCFWFLRATCPDECVETVQCLGDSRWRGYALAAESRKWLARKRLARHNTVQWHIHVHCKMYMYVHADYGEKREVNIRGVSRNFWRGGDNLPLKIHDLFCSILFYTQFHLLRLYCIFLNSLNPHGVGTFLTLNLYQCNFCRVRFTHLQSISIVF